MIDRQMHYCRPPSSLYVHVPFCLRRCHYCDFYSTLLRTEAVDIWEQTVLKEIEALSSLDTHVLLETVYFGGGTPSAVPAGKITAILEAVRRRFGIAPDAEITLEANPESVSDQALATWKTAGVNRLSLGIQSLDPVLLAELGRLHDGKSALTALDKAKKYMKNVSCDLMIGLPGQTEATVARDLECLLQAGIDHLSFYSLTIEPGTVFFERYGTTETTDDEESAERAMYWLIRERLSAQGFDVYEISNAAKPEKKSRHNLVYWHALPYYAVGPGAASYAFGLRMKNPDSLVCWSDAVRNNPGTPFAAAGIEEMIDDESAAREMVMLGLRLTEGVFEQAFFDRFGLSLEETYRAEIKRQVNAGLLQLEDGFLRLTRRGIDFANIVLTEFV